MNTWDIRKKVVCFDITYKVECHWQRNYKPNHKLLFNNLSLETAWHTKPFRQLNSFFVLILSIQVLISNNYENVWPLIRFILELLSCQIPLFFEIYFLRLQDIGQMRAVRHKHWICYIEVLCALAFSFLCHVPCFYR